MRSEAEKSNKEDGSDESSRWSWNSRSSSDLSSPAAQVDWLIRKPPSSVDSGVMGKPPLSVDESKVDEQGSEASESEMMKERFSKLLLGEDMSGSGNGVCSALAISNAITNLYATVFGQLWRLEPLPSEKKSMWRREMEWFLCVSDYIVEMIPAWHKLPDGDRVEIMSSRQRLDLVINLPALRTLDNMLLEILDGFNDPEFWYVDQGIAAPEARRSVSFRKAMERQEGKWWLPVPRVPPSCLTEGTRNHLCHKLECASQVLKAASAINSSVLADMEVPESYSESLPKSGKTCLGNVIYRYITSEQFSSDCLLDCLDLSSEHAALEMANRVESAIYVWIRKLRPKHSTKESCSSKSSWEIVRDLVLDGDKRGLLVERAENLLLSIKQRYPGLTQTTLDSCKIHCNKDVGKSILESYSRVLESLAFSVVARIEDLLYVDDINKHKKLSVTLIHPEKSPVSFRVPISGTNRTAYATPIFSPAEGEKMPFTSVNSDKPMIRVLGPKRVVVNYISGDEDAKDSGRIVDGLASISHRTIEGTSSQESSSSVDTDTETRRQGVTDILCIHRLNSLALVLPAGKGG